MFHGLFSSNSVGKKNWNLAPEPTVDKFGFANNAVLLTELKAQLVKCCQMVIERKIWPLK